LVFNWFYLIGFKLVFNWFLIGFELVWNLQTNKICLSEALFLAGLSLGKRFDKDPSFHSNPIHFQASRIHTQTPSYNHTMNHGNGRIEVV
jgi:hypothetical protein